MISFNGNIFILGCGGIAQCTLPLLLRHLDVDPNRITIMDFVDNRNRIKEYLQTGVQYKQEKLNPENYPQILHKYLHSGDLFIDLSWSVDTCELLKWCHDNQILYLNTSVEEWDPYGNLAHTHPARLTLYHRHMLIKKLIASWNKKGATAIVDHGANPGLVSHFTKQALIEISLQLLQQKNSKEFTKALELALVEKKFAKLAQLCQVQVIHIAERDTQITNKSKQVNEFVNTWSVEGLIEEGLAPAELGWGTHEKALPVGAMQHSDGPKNQIFLASRGMDTWVRSWVPSGPIVGMVIRHGEAYSISDRLTVWQDEKAIYRPTVHYAYCPTDSAIASLHELRMRNFNPQQERRIMHNDIVNGKDELGCLLMGPLFNSWWIGSSLHIDQARRLVPEQNATTLQVAISLVAATMYAIKNPQLGFCLPDDIDHEEILTLSKPYLGEFISEPTEWNPLQNPNPHMIFGSNIPSQNELWQFATFRVRTDLYKQ